MSSFIGHSLTALSIDALTGQPQRPPLPKGLWLLGLVIVASMPDLDYLIPALQSSAHHGLRITHSLGVSLFVPIVAIVTLFYIGIRGRQLQIASLQLILAGLSHLGLDLLVGVKPLPLLWPLSGHLFKLSFGILPSAGRIALSNYYFYRNFFIEMGVLVPLFWSLYCIQGKLRDRAVGRFRMKETVAIAALLLCSLLFMCWAYSLSR